MKDTDRDALLTWYRENARSLPWRGSSGPYAVLVSEMMLQQTTVAAVKPLYHRWMARFPTLEALAEAATEDVMFYWSGLGYYQRARRLHRAAREICQHGAFPRSYEELLELPGLGPYTAAAVASIAFGEPSLALDTNAIRVLFRYYGLNHRADHRPSLKQLRQSMAPHLAKSEPGDLNQALMELGATVCTARAPSCLACCWNRSCRARQTGEQAQIPAPKPKKKPLVTTGRAYLLTQRGLILLVKGTSLGLLGELFQPPLDFPQHNRLDSPLSPWLQELRLRFEDGKMLGRLNYGISGRRLELELLALPVEESLEAPVPTQWVNPEQPEVAVSSLTRKTLKVFQGSLVTPPP